MGNVKGVKTLNGQNSIRLIDLQIDQFIERHGYVSPRQARRDRPDLTKVRRSWGSFFKRRES